MDAFDFVKHLVFKSYLLGKISARSGQIPSGWEIYLSFKPILFLKLLHWSDFYSVPHPRPLSLIIDRLELNAETIKNLVSRHIPWWDLIYGKCYFYHNLTEVMKLFNRMFEFICSIFGTINISRKIFFWIKCNSKKWRRFSVLLDINNDNHDLSITVLSPHDFNSVTKCLHC